MREPYFVDLHCDTLLCMQQEGNSLADASGHINLAGLLDAKALLQCFAAFIPMNNCAEQYGIRETPWEYFLLLADLFDREMEKHSALIRPVRSMGELMKNREEGLVSAMLTVEDGACIDGRIDRVKTLYDRGVRLITLTWNYENCIGFPNADDSRLHAKGLKPFGFDVLAEMDKLGIVVDVSHLSEGGFWDVVRAGTKPFVASHSCARALCGHRRNLTDDQLRALADRGGVCGVNFYADFLKKDAGHTENKDILRHMEHIVKVAGVETAALGSDFDGIDCTLEIRDYRGLPHLAECIADRFGSDAADKICRDNALRVLKDVIG